MAPSVAATEAVSGHGGGLDKKTKVPAKVSSPGDEMLVLNTIRCLAADLCQQVSTSVRKAVYGEADGPVQRRSSWYCHGCCCYWSCFMAISHEVQPKEPRLGRT